MRVAALLIGFLAGLVAAPAADAGRLLIVDAASLAVDARVSVNGLVTAPWPTA